jgi:hypothetical protein
MKCKLLLITFFTISTWSASAQIKKGSILLGGSLQVYTQKSEPLDTRYTQFGIRPAVGKAIKDNLIAGFDLGFTSNATRNPDSSSIKINEKAYGAGFFLRKYATLGKNFYLFGQGRLGAGYYRNKYSPSVYPSNRAEGFTIDLNFYPGVAYSVTNKIQLEAGLPSFLSLTYDRFKQHNNYKGSSFNASTSLSNAGDFSVGVRVLLNRQ